MTNNSDNSHVLNDLFNVGAAPPPKEIQAITDPGITTALVRPSTGERVIRPEAPPAEEVIAGEERLEDLAIDSKLERVHESAIEAYKSQFKLSQEVESRFSARNAEVAAQYLKIALDSVSLRVDSKFKRNKIKLAQEKKEEGAKGRGTILVADRNEVLRVLSQALQQSSPAEKTVEGEVLPEMKSEAE